MSDEALVPARYYVLLGEFLDSQGVSVAHWLDETGIDRRLFDEPGATLTHRQTEDLLNAAERLSGREDIGFELGRLIKLSSHDILGFAILNCHSVDQSLRLCARHYRLITPAFTFLYERTGKSGQVLFAPALPFGSNALRLNLERHVVSFHTQLKSRLREFIGPYDIDVSYPAPKHAARYHELFPARVHFGQMAIPGVRIRLGEELLDRVLPDADMHAMRLAEKRCRQLLAEVNARSNWGDWLTMMLMGLEGQQPTLDEFARMLNVSARALQRHLSREHIGFRRLAEEVRHRRACELLRLGTISVSQVAYRLGYTDVANFSRAFRRSSGTSPTRYAQAPQVALDARNLRD